MVVNSSPSGLLGPRSSSNNKYVVSIFLSLLVMVANATSISETEAKSPIESYPKSPDYSPVNTKMYLSDSGELSFLAAKRAKPGFGFVPARGKKGASLYDLFASPGGPMVGGYLYDSPEMSYLKRSSGFLPMRGRKSDGFMEVPAAELVEKRDRDQINSFMPMRGRKSYFEDDFVPPPARQAFYMKNSKLSKSSPISQEPSEIGKRNMGFVGMRG